MSTTVLVSLLGGWAHRWRGSPRSWFERNVGQTRCGRRVAGRLLGYLVADAHAVYDHLYRNGAVIEVGCGAHARRYFFKAIESDPERAKTALAWIGAIRVRRDLLCLLPRWPSHCVLELAPAYWCKTLEKREAQEILNAR